VPGRAGPRPRAAEVHRVLAGLEFESEPGSEGGRRPRQMGSTHQRGKGEEKEGGPREGNLAGELLAGRAREEKGGKEKGAGWAVRWRKERPARARP
jgi:hypothetical protein